MLEKDFQRKVLARLRTLPRSWWTKVNDNTTTGVPDILGCVGPYFVALELKTKSTLSELQFINLQKLDRCEAQSFCVAPANWNEIFEYLKTLSAKSKAPAGLLKPARFPLWALPPSQKKSKGL
jgi:hypothetical protein